MTVIDQPTATQVSELDQHYPLTDEQIRFFRQNGYIKLKQVLSPETLAYYGDEISRKVIELNTMNLPMEKRNTYQKAFLQIMNLWLKSDIVKEFVMSKRLGRIAAELMGVTGVRLYHDQALYKEPSGGITPWHADQFYWPLSNENTCTVWIPLQETPMNMGPLGFAEKSHNMEFGRDLEISDTSEQQLQDALKQANYPLNDTPFDLGEVSYHYGWTYHRAGPNTSDKARKVMTIIYLQDGMRVINPRHNAHTTDLRNWLPGLKPGDLAESELNPLIYRACSCAKKK
jgi:ectoine hydroxylase-related dioxygenase (phytanoyl-CoA dioxygenase family)